VYVAGFIIVTLHHSQYGIGELSLLRARVFSAGILFGILTALPVVAASRQYGYFGLGPQVGKIHIQSQNDWAANVVDGTWLYLPCSVLAFVTIFLFQDWFHDFTNSHYSWWQMVLTIFVFATLAVTGRLVANYLWTCAIAAVIAVVVGGWVLYAVEGLTFLRLSLWFFFCALITKWSVWLLREPSKLRSIEWERTFLGLVIFFAQSIYGHVQFRFGGGATVPVRLHLTADAPKLFATDPALALLLEETDGGFYVLRTTQDKSSLFLPRTIVKALEFNVPDEGSQGPGH
jgi:hypothetical protein